eukprot:7279259-Heterocapsa_arctica.AAC.1
MKESLNNITDENIPQMISLPFFEMIKQKNQEMLYAANPLKEFEGTKLASTMKEGLNIKDENEKNNFEKLRAKFEMLMKLMKKVLGNKVEKVMVNGCVAESLYVMNMERLVKL